MMPLRPKKVSRRTQQVIPPNPDPPVPPVIHPQPDPPGPPVIHPQPDPPGPPVIPPQPDLPDQDLPPPAPLVVTAAEKTKDTLSRLGIKEPSAKAMNIILPLHEIAELVRSAPSATRNAIVAEHRGGAVPRYGQKSSIARALGMCRNAVLPSRKRVPKDHREKIAAWKKVAVNGFLRRDDNSCTLPDKRHYTKKKAAQLGEPGERFVVALVDTLRNLHRKFIAETGVTVSFTTFTRARDRNSIHTSVFLKRSVCLCTPHANMGYILEAIPGLLNSTTALCKLTDEEVTTGLASLDDLDSVRFKRWGKDTKTYTKKVKDKRTKKLKRVEFKVTHTVLRKLRFTKTDFKDLFLKDLPTFREHHRRVGEQYAAVRKLKEVLPHDHAAVHMDYAENWSTSFMHEIQSAFFGKDQLTLHPMVVYHREREDDLQEELRTSSFVGVSEVIQHSFPTTLAFLKKLVPHIKTLVPDLSHLHVITDSPSSQYRNRFTCGLLERPDELMPGIRLTWNWLEAGHGKGPCDGLGGAVKGLADRVVKTAGSIQDADEFVEHVAPQTKKITLLRTTRRDVDTSDETVDSWKCQPVNGISTQHQATVYQGKLHLRETSCYKECCMEDDLRPSCVGWTTAHQPNPRMTPTPSAARPVAKDVTTTDVQTEDTTTTGVTDRSDRLTAATPDTITTMDCDSDSDSDPDWDCGADGDVEAGSDSDAEVGGNEHGVREEMFTSDDDSIDVAAVRAVEREKRRHTRSARSARSARGNVLEAKRVVREGVEGTDVEDGPPSDDDDDLDYTPEPETPEEASRHADITTRRRRGEIVNELYNDDGETSSDDWAVLDIIPISKVLKVKK